MTNSDPRRSSVDLARRIAELEEANGILIEHRDRLGEALRVIAGPWDEGPWIEVYRRAGGGYEGLQAIARGALGDA